MSYKIYESVDQSLITVSFADSVDDQEIMRMMDELYRLPSFAIADQFIDFSLVKHYEITPHGMMSYNQVAKQRPEREPAKTDRKVVIYAPDDLTFGMARLLATIASNSGINIEVFRYMAKALDFIGLETIPVQSKKNGSQTA